MFKKILANEFNKNVLKLITGTTMAQAIPIAISPILTRIYSPDDFGVLALFIAVASIFGSIANGRYELAIVLPVKKEDSINLVALSIIISICVSSLLLITILLFNRQITSMIGNEDLTTWLYFVPIIVFFIGLFNALNYLNTRMKTFGLIAKVKVIKAVTLSLTQVTLGILKFGAGGLIAGQIVSHVFTNWNLAKGVIKDRKLISCINKSNIIKQAKRYSRFPKFTLWATLCNSLSLHLINVFISMLYSTTTLGFYSVVQRALGMPSNLISQSIGQVFFEKASEEKRITGNAAKTYMSTIIKLSIISIIIFGILFIFVEDIFGLVFGEDWRIAGYYAKFLIPLFLIRFIASPLTLINIIFEKQNIDLVWQVSLLFTSIFIYILTWYFNLEVISFFILNTSVLIINYLIVIYITYYVATNKAILKK